MKKYSAEIISFILLVSGMALNGWNISWFEPASIQFAWYLLAFLPVGLPVLKEAWECVREKDYFNEYMLMSLATIGAFYIGEYPEGVTVMLFYAVGEQFQDNAVRKARSNISALLDVRPQTATVLVGNDRLKVSPESVRTGETIEVKAGERIPLDGTMLGQAATFNTSALTGESMPRVLKKTETVLAGMIPTDKVIRLRVSKPYNESTLARILAMVQDASERKAPAELFIRRFARVYTPIVTGLAVLIVLLPYLYSIAQPEFIFDFDNWLSRALVFLVISCPCALVVSIPLGYFGGIGAASRHGILFKGGNYLDAITRINTVVFDKTGTLTKGVFQVDSVKSASPVTERELVALAASVETGSNHPVAKAIVAYADGLNLPYSPVKEVTETAGYGLSALINGKKILAGNARLLSKHAVLFPSEILSIPETVVMCAVDGRYAGYILLADTLKEDAPQAVADLKSLNITNIRILSGDKQAIVSKLAQHLGITEAYGDLLPEGKVEQLEKLKQDSRNRIAFVGDGMNDAPVLALSDVGIAMGGLGSDAAIETADVVIQTDQPGKVATAIRIGKHTRRVVWQNISMAFGVKLIVLLLGASGYATLWEAVFADVGVALLAILNAVRIQKLIK